MSEPAVKQAGKYCRDPFLRSFGVEAMREKMTRRYGQRYLDYRALWERAENREELDFPVNLEFDLIDSCTLKCPMCLRAADLIGDYPGLIGTRKHLSYESVVKALAEGREHGLPSVNIGGSGECMLHPRFLDACQAIMDHDVLELRVITNGTLLSEERAAALLEMQVHFVSVSIDAASPEVYGEVRGKARQFQEVEANVLRLARLRQERGQDFPMIRVSFARQPANVHETERFIEFWSPHTDLIDIQAFCDYRRAPDKHDWQCTDPWKRLEIWADGHVGPCCGFPGIVFDLGNIAADSLRGMWHSKEMARIRRMLLSEEYEPCCSLCRGTRVDFDERGAEIPA